MIFGESIKTLKEERTDLTNGAGTTGYASFSLLHTIHRNDLKQIKKINVKTTIIGGTEPRWQRE